MRRITRRLVVCSMAMGLIAICVGPASAGASAGGDYGYKRCPMPGSKALVIDFGTPRFDVQGTVNMRASSSPGGSVWVKLSFEDSAGREVPGNYFSTRPANGSASFPADGRGFSNIRRVWVEFGGDPTGVDCSVSVTGGPSVPTADQQCFTTKSVVQKYKTPQASAEVQVLFETRATGEGIALQAVMTDSVGSESVVGGVGLGPWEDHPRQTYYLPEDRRGVNNVVRSEFRFHGGLYWWNVLRCHVSFSTAGDLPAVESQCFAGSVTLPNPTPSIPSEMVLEIEMRPSVGWLLAWDAFHEDGSSAGGALWGPYGELPPTVERFGGNLQNVATFRVRTPYADWTKLLRCKPSIQPLHSIDPPPDS